MSQAPTFKSLRDTIDKFNKESQAISDKFNSVLKEVVTLGDGFLNAGATLRRTDTGDTYYVSHDCNEVDVEKASEQLAAAQSDEERVGILVQNKILKKA